MKREHWKSRFGFMWAAIGSAIGLGSIWRFPYVVGENGGALFICIFVFCLVIVGLPTLLSEIIIGRMTHLNPKGAFKAITNSSFWSKLGGITVLTGFIISSFYSVIAGWTLGYLFESVFFGFKSIVSSESALQHFNYLTGNSFWSLSFHAIFMFLSGLVLYFGIQKGIESWNKFFMPLLMVVLFVLVIHGLMLPNSSKAIKFLLMPNWDSFNSKTILVALGQAFFGLSLGQGTMITYGSYLTRKENILNICIPIVTSVVFVSLLAGIAIYTTVFSQNMPLDSGPNLMFQVLPLVFSKMIFGKWLGVLFFLLIFIAGWTSQISAMEPTIAYLIENKRFTRNKSVIICSFCSFLLGVPSALSFGLLKSFTISDKNFFEIISYISINILVPLGGLAAVLLIGYKITKKEVYEHIDLGATGVLKKSTFIKKAFIYLIKYIVPIVITCILIN